MDDLDAMLNRLAHAPLPPALDMIECQVLAKIASRPAARTAFGVGALSVALALAMGIFAGGGSLTPANRASSLSPLSPDSPLAPSTLLAGEP